MKRRWIGMALLLTIFSLLALEMRSQVSAHAGNEHPMHEMTAPDQRATQITTVAFGGDLGFAYSPQNSFILPGDAMRWLGDFAAHPLVSDDGLWGQVNEGSEFTFTFNQPGKYAFHCFIHGSMGMNGTVTVGATYFLPLLMN